MEDLNRLHVFYASDEADGTGGFRDVLVTQADHPFLDMWWPPGHTIGWEHSFAHEWRDFLSAVIDDRPLSPEQASFEDGVPGGRHVRRDRRLGRRGPAGTDRRADDAEV